MPILLLLVASSLLIALPLLAAHLERTKSWPFDPSDDEDEDARPDVATFVGEESGDRSQGTTKQDVQYQRKPWDPPFPLPSTRHPPPHLSLPARRLADQPAENNVQLSPLLHSLDALPTPANPATPPPCHQTEAQAPQLPVKPLPCSAPPANSKTRLTPPLARTRSVLRSSLVQSVILVLAFLIFVFAFAVLVAHCLAWFVVYKTEVRLGELRKGLLRGGDMRVCLCSR